MSTELQTIDHETGEIVPAVVPVNLFGTDNPEQVIALAADHAKALTDVIKARRLSVRVGNKEHVLVEAWTMLGSMLGVFPVEDGEAEPVEVNGVHGFKASVNAVTRNGEVVGRATAYCMRDEANWRNRDTYALASMAQTRATSKALRMPLGFIVTLAGYNATPAEEIPEGTTSFAPANAAREAAAREAQPKPATAAQHAKLNAALKELEAKAPIQDQQSWVSALKAWAKELGFPGSRKAWSTVQMSAAIEQVEGWLADESIPFLTGSVPGMPALPAAGAAPPPERFDNDANPDFGQRPPLPEGGNATDRPGSSRTGQPALERDRDPSPPSESGPLTPDQLGEFCKRSGYSRADVTAARNRVFPGVPFRNLTDEQRGLLADALTKEAVTP